MEQESMKTTAAVGEFIRHCRFERKLDEKTISAYRMDLEQFTATVGGDPSLRGHAGACGGLAGKPDAL